MKILKSSIVMVVILIVWFLLVKLADSLQQSQDISIKAKNKCIAEAVKQEVDYIYYGEKCYLEAK